MSVDEDLGSGLIPTSDLITAEEAFETNPDTLEVPAVSGKEAVKILPKAVFFRADHGQRLIEYPKNADWPTARKTKAAYYAAYMFKTLSGQVRFIVVPVALLGDHQYDSDLLKDMVAQGLDPEDVKKNCRFKDVEDVFGDLNTKSLPDLRRMMREKTFVSRGFNHRYGGYIDSGWTPNPEDLNIVGKEFVDFGARMNPYYTGAPSERYATGVHAVSQPLNLNTAVPFEKEIYKRVLQANAVAAKK